MNKIVNSIKDSKCSANVDDISSVVHRYRLCYSATIKADKSDASRRKVYC